MRQGRGIREVIYRDEVEVLVAFLHRCSENKPADPAETVNTYLGSHLTSSIVL